MALSDIAFDLDLPLFSINIDIGLTAHEFLCLFGQSWECDPNTFLYNTDILLCNLRKFWLMVAPEITQIFVHKYNSLDLDTVTSEQDVYTEFMPEKGILYKYFHEDDITKGYEQIGSALDAIIERECRFNQVFYFNRCDNTIPNLPIGSSITLQGRLIIKNIPIIFSLRYIIISA